MKKNTKNVTEVTKKSVWLPQKNFSFLKLYLMLVSVAWVIWTTVCLGIILYQTLSIKLITNEEYVQTQYYELDSCNYAPYNYSKEVALVEDWSTVQKDTWTQEDIDKCKNDKTENVILRRYAEYKQWLIWAISWWFVFFVLFLTHFPFFIKKDKNKI